jgi:transcriptional regulator with XRE-family HTH domain
MSFLCSGMSQVHSIRSPQDLGALLAQARKRRGLSQRQLAAEFVVSQAWISQGEQGYQKTWIGQVFRLAVYLGVELSVGSGNSDNRENSAPMNYPDLDQLV